MNNQNLKIGDWVRLNPKGFQEPSHNHNLKKINKLIKDNYKFEIVKVYKVNDYEIFYPKDKDVKIYSYFFKDQLIKINSDINLICRKIK